MDVASVSSREPRRQVDPELARSCRDLAERSAGVPILRRVPIYPEPSRLALERRVGRRLRPTEHGVYGLLRAALRMRRPGMHLANAEVASLLGCSERSVIRAVRSLGPHEPTCPPECRSHLNLIRRVELFQTVSWCDAVSKKTYHRRQEASVTIAGPAARRPGRPRVRPPDHGRGYRPESAAGTGRRDRVRRPRKPDRVPARPKEGRPETLPPPRQIVTPTAPPSEGGDRAGRPSAAPALDPVFAAAGPDRADAAGEGVPFGDGRASGALTGPSPAETREPGDAGRSAGDAPATPSSEPAAPASSEAKKETIPAPSELELWARERLEALDRKPDELVPAPPSPLAVQLAAEASARPLEPNYAPDELAEVERWRRERELAAAAAADPGERGRSSGRGARDSPAASAAKLQLALELAELARDQCDDKGDAGDAGQVPEDGRPRGRPGRGGRS
jgi:hypothetical protein